MDEMVYLHGLVALHPVVDARHKRVGGGFCGSLEIQAEIVGVCTVHGVPGIRSDNNPQLVRDRGGRREPHVQVQRLRQRVDAALREVALVRLTLQVLCDKESAAWLREMVPPRGVVVHVPKEVSARRGSPVAYAREPRALLLRHGVPDLVLPARAVLVLGVWEDGVAVVGEGAVGTRRERVHARREAWVRWCVEAIRVPEHTHERFDRAELCAYQLHRSRGLRLHRCLEVVPGVERNDVLVSSCRFDGHLHIRGHLHEFQLQLGVRNAKLVGGAYRLPGPVDVLGAQGEAVRRSTLVVDRGDGLEGPAPCRQTKL
eukprot:scaffold93405_cov28-Prasinocladus_malaysianus.AAC.2